jgi:phosphoribosylglycinamide formyltransferase-1
VGRLKMAVLLSGSGTTLQNLLDRISHGKLNAQVVLVLSDRQGVFGLTRAAQANIPHEVIDRKSFSSAQAFSETMFESIRASGADLVVMAGFLRLLPIPADFTHKVMNIHPSLIPSFCGKGFHGHHVHQAVLDAGNKITGCTVHFADNEYDHGPILVQKAVEVAEDDTADSLAKRVFAVECEAYPEAIEAFLEERIRVSGRTARIVRNSDPAGWDA